MPSVITSSVFIFQVIRCGPGINDRKRCRAGWNRPALCKEREKNPKQIPKHSADTWQRVVGIFFCACWCRLCCLVTVPKRRKKTRSTTGLILTNLHWKSNAKRLFILMINKNRWLICYSALQLWGRLVSNRVYASRNCWRSTCLSGRITIKKAVTCRGGFFFLFLFSAALSV